MNEAPLNSFADAFEGIDFDFSDDGEIVVQDRRTPAESDDTVEEVEETEEVEVEAEETAAPEVADTSANDALLQKIADLEAKLEQALKAKEEKVSAEDDLDEIDEDVLNDPKKSVELVKTMVQDIVSKALEPYREIEADFRIRREFEHCVRTYPDFPEYIPQMKKVIDKRPDLSFEEAYKLAKEFAPPPAKSLPDAQHDVAKSDRAEAASPKTVSASQLKERAAKLTTEQGIGGDPTPRAGEPKSLRDAFAAALDEVLSE